GGAHGRPSPRGEKPYATPIFQTDTTAPHRAVSDSRDVALFIRRYFFLRFRPGRKAGQQGEQKESEAGRREERESGKREGQERIQALEGRRRPLDHHR